MRKVMIYTDGACSGNPGPGGWSAILVCGSNEKELSGGKTSTTNNEMELTAAVEALSALKSPCAVELYSDSAYLVNCMTQGWYRKWQRNGWKTAEGNPVANRELWEQLIELTEKHDVTFLKVKGHAGHEYNERCDQLAKAAVPKANSEDVIANMEYEIVAGLRDAILKDQEDIPKESIEELERPARETAEKLLGMSALDAAVTVAKMDRKLLEQVVLKLVDMYHE
jgi:ribonuclease HI